MTPAAVCRSESQRYWSSRWHLRGDMLFYNVLTQWQSANGPIISTLFLKCFISSKQKFKLFLQANFTWNFFHQLNWHSQLNAANLQLEQKPTDNLIMQYFGNYFPAIFLKQQSLKLRFTHSTSNALNQYCEHDSQLSIWLNKRNKKIASQFVDQ